MAQVQITDLPQALPLSGAESVPIVQNGVTVQTTTGAISGAGALNYPFLTVGSTVGLAEARYISTGSGLSVTDNGAGNTLQINLIGAAQSLDSSSAGIQVKTGSNTLTGREIVVGAGLTIADGDGVAGDPTISLGTVLSNFAALTGTGILAIQSGLPSKIDILGVTNQISITNGDGSSDVTVGLANNPVAPGQGSLTLPVGATGQRVTNLGAIRYNTDLQVFEGYTNAGWNQFSVAGGVVSFSAGSTGFTPNTDTTGVVTLGGILNASSGGTGASGLTGYVYGNGASAMTASATIPTTDLSGTVTNAQLANSAITINGSSVSLGGSITVTATASNALTIGTGLTGTSYDGSAPVTIAIDSSVVTLTGSQTLTNKSISGATNTLSAIPNASLDNSSVTYNGVNVALGAGGTITAVNPYNLTIGTGLSGGSYDGSGAVTVAIDSTVATLSGTQTLTNKSISGSTNTLTNIANSSLTNSSVTVGTTSIALGASSLTLGGLTSVAVTQDPTTALQVATKQYVDSLAASGIHYHEPVYLESPDTAGNLNATYNQPGGAGDGVGATLTNAGTQVALTVDGVLTTVGMRVLIYNQTNQYENGVYTVTTVGNGSTNWVLTRATDADTYSPFSPNSLGQGDAFFVQAGNTGAGETYICNTVGTIVFGTTAITFAQISSAQVYSAGTGLTLTNTTFSITNTAVTPTSYGSASSVATFTVNAQGQLTAAAATSIAINGNQITSGTVGSAYISGSYTGITGVGTLTAGTWNATTIDPGYGGTGLASYTAGDLIYATGTTTLAKLAIGATNYVLTSSGAAPQYVAQSTLSVGSATTATTATNVAGGAAGSLVYQTGSGATSTLALGTSGYVLTAGASAPTYVAQSTLSVGSATNATNTAITANSTNATNYLTFVSATSGNLPQLVNSSITCNPSTGQITGGIAGGSF